METDRGRTRTVFGQVLPCSNGFHSIRRRSHLPISLAYIFRSLRWYGFVEMMMYIAILLVGYLYLWKKGALDWHK